jgi:outer membrane protein assembly factor BamB
MKSLLTMLPLMLALSVSAQPPDTIWTRQVGAESLDEYSYSLDCTPDGGFLAAGTAMGTSTYQWMLAKLSADGEPAWTHLFGDWVSEECLSFGCPTDGGCFLARCEMGDFCLTKVDANGDSLWSTWLGTESPDPFLQGHAAPDGGCLLLGRTEVDGVNDQVLVVRVDAVGTALWTRTCGTPELDWVIGVEFMPDGGWMIPFVVDLFGAHQHALLRLNADGDSLWCRMYEGVVFHSVYAMADGQCMMGATVNGQPSLLMLNNAGDVVWSHTYLFLDEAPTLLSVNLVNDEIISFYCSRANESCHFALFCAGITRDSVWSRTYGANLSQSSNLLGTCTADGGFILGGNVWAMEWSGDLYFVRLTPAGQSANPRPEPTPEAFTLSAYPNPFNVSAQITISLPHEQRAGVTILSVLGRHVVTLHNGTLEAGEHQFTFNASALPSGVYFARVQAGSFIKTQKLLLLK